MLNPVALVLSLLVMQVTGQSAETCFTNEANCFPAFRNRYLDIDHFYFGSPFSTFCPGGLVCLNSRPDLQSVMSRILFTNDTSQIQVAVNNMGILNVTFDQPARSYYACHHKFDVQATDPVTVDPLGPFLVSQQSLHYKPHITWEPRTSTIRYMVILWDVSVMFLHSVFTNCVGGSIETCQAPVPWLGPSVADLVNSAYAFLVYEQTAEMPTQTVLDAVGEVNAQGAGVSAFGQFRVDIFLGKLAAYVNPAIQYSVIMEVYPDPYGSYRLSNFFNAITQCPQFHTQLPAFHAAMNGMQIPVKWTPPAFSFSQLSTDSYLSTIRVDIQVTYTSNDHMDTVCCRDFTISRGTYIPDPFETQPWNAGFARNTPDVMLNPILKLAGRGPISSDVYTLIMVDVAPALNPTASQPLLVIHWVVANILQADFETGTEVLPYFGPNPPGADQVNTYMFLLFKQSGQVDPDDIASKCPSRPRACRLNMTEIINTWNLQDIHGANWFQARRDDFALKRVITHFGWPEAQVCEGQPGYDSPCPAKPETCSAIGQVAFTSQLLIGLLAFLSSVLK